MVATIPYIMILYTRQIPVNYVTYSRNYDTFLLIYSLALPEFNLESKSLNLKLFIKYMVSNRCIMLVKDELKKLGLHFIVDLGVADIMEDIRRNSMSK